MLPLFYTPTIEPHHEAFVLDEAESKHAVRVLRLGMEAEVGLVDGRGTRYRAQIADPHPKRTVLKIVEARRVVPRPYYVHIAIAPTKNIERLEWFLEKATEVGVDEVTPIICEHSERKEVKLDRLNKIVVAAMKQSLKAELPKLNEPVKYAQFLAQAHEGVLAIAHCAPGEKRYLADVVGPGGRSVVLIGPEGDFSESEIELAQAAGFLPATLGDTRLRTETAAVAACMEIAFINR